MNPATVEWHAVCAGSVADITFGALSFVAQLPAQETGSGRDQSHILVSLLPVGEICFFRDVTGPTAPHALGNVNRR